jgi:hypothetical protein
VKFSDIAAELPNILHNAFGESLSDVTIERQAPSRHDDQPWLDVKYGPSGSDDLHGVEPIRVTTGSRSLDLVIKVNPLHGIGETLIPWICQTHGVTLPAPYPTFHSTREVVGTGAREANLYELSNEMPALMAILPRYYGTIVASGERALVLGDEGEIAGLDAGGAIASWSDDHIDLALRAIGSVHAASAPLAPDVAWLPPRPDTATMTADAALWRALLDEAAQRSPEVVTADVHRQRSTLIDTIDQWHPAKDALPTVIAHNDFNQRNVGFLADDRVVALDWEIVRKDAPTRDVAELLTFLLTDQVTLDQLEHHAEQHRLALAATGLDIPRPDHRAALAADLRSEAIDRVGMQWVFEAAFDLPYVPRINHTVDHLTRITAGWLA